MAEHEDRDYGIPHSGIISSEYDGDYISHEGYITTRHGYVIVWSRPMASGPPRAMGDANTRLEFIHGGRLYVRYFGDIFQPRYLVTLARQFAADIAAKEPRNE